jgi:hypothetical protein
LIDVDLANPIDGLLHGRHFLPPLAVSRTAVDHFKALRCFVAEITCFRTVQTVFRRYP